jgi:hypothetical protein
VVFFLQATRRSDVNKLALAAVLLAAPLAARAEVGLRIGGEADIAYNNNDGRGTKFLTSDWPLAGDIMLSYWTPGSLLSVDLELSEQFLLNPPTGANGRIGTVLRPGVRLSPPILPIYLRAAIPINIETNGGDREKFDLRLGAGITIPLVLFKIYIEADADFPLSSGPTGSQVSTFNTWNLWLNGGLDFRF